MSHDMNRKSYFSRDPRNRDRDRDREWERPDYRSRQVSRRSRSPHREDKRRSGSPRKSEKDIITENILSEISKLPEPSELWEGQQPSFTAPPPQSVPVFPPEPVPNTTYNPSYQPSYPGIYDDFPPVGSISGAPPPPDMASWNQMSLPPPPTAAPPPPFMTADDQIKKEAAIESEMRHQKAALSKQREDYIKKTNILKKELETLKDQRNELRGDSKRSPSPDTKRFLKENTKLQLEIQNKLKTINNVVDMLNGIIGEEAQEIVESDDSPDRSSKRKSRSPSGRKFNYVYYDPEMHWCRVCNEFPPTAKDYLNHLHSAAHQKMAAAHMEAPWHSVTGANEGFPNHPAAPTKRTPIRGLQFFVPSTAWYCKLCDQFIGDLHCASAHLKSIQHSKNYTNFVEQNPHWETDWMSDRQKAFEKARSSAKGVKTDEKPAAYASHTITFSKDGFQTKKKDSPPPIEDKKSKKKEKKMKKKKKHSSSSSSSSSDSSDSEPVKKKKKKKSKGSDADDKTLQEWMSAIQADRLNNSDRKLLDTLKTRIKLDKEKKKNRSLERIHDRERSIESRKQRESERREFREPPRRDDRRDDRDRDRRDDRREDRRDDRRLDRARTTPPRSEAKKPEIRKMPFIGKMPVYKSLSKTKTEEQKKEEEKKKEEDEASKKKREEMDAEIQKKVAEFKEKIARAQLERQQAELGPPGIALPTALGQTMVPTPTPTSITVVPPPAPTPAPAQPTAPALPKDFQDALDIIFPTEVKPDMSQTDIFGNVLGPTGFPMGLGGVMPSFPPFLQPQMPHQMMMGFDINSSLFPPRPQLYDSHVPLVTNNKVRMQKTPKPIRFNHTHKAGTYVKRPNPNKYSNDSKPTTQNNEKSTQKTEKTQNTNQTTQNNNQTTQSTNQPTHIDLTTENETKPNGPSNPAAVVTRKKEELDELAMLGIDESDVGAM